jgi:polyferredoxin
LSNFVDRLAGKSLLSTISAHLFLILLSLLCGFISVCYVVSPYDAIPALLSSSLGPIALGSTVVIAILTYINLAFIRRTFCATICPYGKIQGALTDDKSLLIQLDPLRKDECIDCKSCVRVCPTRLDIRKGMQVACIMCARCVDACAGVMAKQEKKSLIQYSFGVKGVSGRSELIRPASIVLALVCVFAFSVFVYKSTARSSFDFSILPHPMQARATKKGGVMNAYILSITNKRQQDMYLKLSLQPAEQTPFSFSHNINDMVLVEGGLVEKYSLFVRSTGKPTEDIPLNITLTAEGDIPESRIKSVYFTVP